MGVDSTIPLVMESITAPKAVIPVHQARSHDEFRPPDLNFTVYAAMTIVSRRWKAQVGWRDIGDAPIFFVPAIVIRLARLGQKLEAIGRSGLVVRWMDVSTVQRIGALVQSEALCCENFSCE